jgi:hypothetical protein
VKKSWKQVAKEFWQDTADIDSKARTKQPKLHRIKVYEWLCATTHMLLIASGKTWDSFRTTPEEQLTKDAAVWPCATVCVDQGGDGWSALHFLASWSCNLIILSDTSHRTWNDVSLAIGDMKWTYHCLLTIIILNLDHGPWAGHRWWNELRSGATEYTSKI